MHSFTDFDAWGEAVRGADLRLACDGVESWEWRLSVRQIGSVVVQVAHEGGGNLCYGVNAHEGIILFLPLTRPEHHVVNCVPLDEQSLFVIMPGADFRIQVRRLAHAWCSIALPPELTGPNPPKSCDSFVARASLTAVQRLKDLVTRVALDPVFEDSGSGVHATAHEQLKEAAIALCPANADEATPSLGRPRVDRAELIRRSMAHLDRADSLAHVSVPGLARACGVSERTLRRAFHDAYGLSPGSYSRLRLLHRVHRHLRSVSAENTTVTDVLTHHGIWSFGQFSARYRRQSGEAMTDTLRRGH